MAFAFKPSNADQIQVLFGIDHEFADYIVQVENMDENEDDYRIPDQKGKVAQIHAYQKYWNVELTLIGPVASKPAGAGSTFQWYTPGSNTKINYFVNSCRLASTYNDTAKWTLTMEAYQSAVYSDETGDNATP